MKLLDLTEATIKPVYHVTLTKHVEKIKQKGLLPMQSSNWVKAGNKERHHHGEIFAFEVMNDAVRWAGKWDWDLYKKFGSGNISIIELKNVPDWEEDDADPLGQAGADGKWLKRVESVKPDQIGKVSKFTPQMLKAVIR